MRVGAAGGGVGSSRLTPRPRRSAVVCETQDGGAVVSEGGRREGGRRARAEGARRSGAVRRAPPTPALAPGEPARRSPGGDGAPPALSPPRASPGQGRLLAGGGGRAEPGPAAATAPLASLLSGGGGRAAGAVPAAGGHRLPGPAGSEQGGGARVEGEPGVTSKWTAACSPPTDTHTPGPQGGLNPFESEDDLLSPFFPPPPCASCEAGSLGAALLATGRRKIRLTRQSGSQEVQSRCQHTGLDRSFERLWQ